MTNVHVKYLAWEQGRAYYIRKIPVDLRFHFSSDGTKSRLKKSLGTTDPRIALKRRDKVHNSVEDKFDYIRKYGQVPDKLDAHEERVRLAAQMGFAYKPIEDLAGAPDEELHERLHYVTGTNEPLTTGVSGIRASVVLGSKGTPSLLLSDVWEQFLKLSQDKARHKSKQQLRIWTHARMRALNNLIEVVGNPDVMEFKRTQALTFKDWWLSRVRSGEVKENTANKDFENLRAIFQKLIDDLALDVPNQWRGIRIEPDEPSKRRSLTRVEILDCLFASNPLRTMNAECRAIVESCAELGTRPIEIINREPSDIILNAEIPHIKIQRNQHGRLKTNASKRDMPLVGAALRAFQKFPNGFPRYVGNSAGCITAINKYFRDHNIMPDGATLYSLRHGFKDRLTIAGAGDEMKKALMGHSLGKVDYGDGPPLYLRLEWLSKIVLNP